MDSGYYDNPESNAAEPRSIVVLKKQFGEIPAQTKAVWASGDKVLHTAEGLFGGNLPDGINLRIVPIESVLKEDAPEVHGIDFDSRKPSENEYMKRFDISQVKTVSEIEPPEPKEMAANITPFHKEKKTKKQTEAVKTDIVQDEAGQAVTVPAEKEKNAEPAQPTPEPVVSPVQKFDSAQIWLIEQGMENGVDVTVYADPKYDWQQMHVIKRGLEQGIDVAVFSNPKYTHGQMGMLLRGLAQDLDVSAYADPQFSAEQMKEIVTGMENGVNVNRYANTQYTWLQMMEIRKGIENGLDVSSYANPAFSDAQMRTFRNALENQANAMPDKAFIRFPLLETALAKAKERLLSNPQKTKRTAKRKKRMQTR